MEDKQLSISNSVSMDDGNFVVELDRGGVHKRESSKWRLPYYSAIKRLTDILVSAVALTLLTPLNLLIMIAIWIDDPHGSPIYVSKRCGKNGREFDLYKFRTMEVNAEQKIETLLSQNEMDGPVFKISKDPRITRLGRYLRKASLDEIPQFLNVLKGDMSIVGPRPPLPREVAQYSAYTRQRLSVMPGLTCIWQIQPNRNQLSFDEWVSLDIEYIARRSFLLDWRIIFGTVKAVIGMHGE